MTHFAEVIDGIVTRIIVTEQGFINGMENSEQWIQTSYNTFHGVNNREGGTALRYNYAGVGYTYDSNLDAFISPKPYASWTLDESICDWIAPVLRPDDGGTYIWNEDDQEWVEIIL